MTNRELAIAIARRGWFVFPCDVDKTPLIPRGFKAADNDRQVVSQWWRYFPEALVGIACSMSGFFAVDIDDCESWNRFENKHNTGAWNTGPMQRTPHGLHLLFRLPLDVHIPNNAGKLAVGVDLRSNGYICSGTGYEWIGEGGFNRPLVDAPAWLLEEIDKLNPHEEQRAQLPPPVKVEGLAAYFLERAVQTARTGNRNNCGFDLALQLRDSGLTEPEARPYMLEFQARCPQNGHYYTDAEALASLRVAYSRPARPPVIRGYGRIPNGR